MILVVQVFHKGGGNGNGWVGGIILNLVPSAIQLACVNSPVFGVENNIGNWCSEWMSVSPQS
jgi:hypothetical protein